MIVVDTNTIAYLLIPGEYTKMAREVLKKDSEWVAPRLWRSEFRNVLVLHVRQHLLTVEQAIQLMQETTSLMRGGEYEVNSAQVLSLASRSGRSAYDCEFIALAQELGVLVVTCDRKVLQAFPLDTVSIEQFVSQ